MRLLNFLLGCCCVAQTLVLSPSQAQENSACHQFAWPLTQEQTWFAGADIPVLQTGTDLPALPKKAVSLNLAAADHVSFALPPAGKAKPANTFGGVITLASVPAGLYQITLSDEGWIDVIQDGQALDADGHTGKRDCPGLRKSVRFRFRSVPTTIQISGVPTSAIKIAIRVAD